jgi:hypothetical protein
MGRDFTDTKEMKGGRRKENKKIRKLELDGFGPYYRSQVSNPAIPFRSIIQVPSIRRCRKMEQRDSVGEQRYQSIMTAPKKHNW